MGIKIAAIMPTMANPIIATNAKRYGSPAWLPICSTRIDPMMETPNDEPKFEMLLDSPEISPWSLSGNCDWTITTEAVNIMPNPAPITKKPGIKYQTGDETLPKARSRAMPMIVKTKPLRMFTLVARRLASLPARAEVTKMPAVAEVNINPVLIALKPFSVWKNTDPLKKIP